MDTEFLKWLGGFWDGEGSFGCYYTTTKAGHEIFNPYASICNTDKEILEQIASQIGAKVTESHVQGGNRKSAGRIRLTGKRATEFASLLEPYLKMKNKQANIVAHWTYRQKGGTRGNSYQKDLGTMEIQRAHYLQLKNLNMRGLSASDLS